MRTYKYLFTLRDGQTGHGLIQAPNVESVGMMARAQFKFSDDVRIYEVEEVADESQSTDD